MLLQLLCGTLFLSVVAGGDDTLYFKSKHHSSDVICPDQKGTCPDGSTCCLLNTGKYGCCPLPQAVCCSDHLHCCPNGYKCDPSSHQCNKGALYVKWHTKTPATPMQKTTPTPKTMCPGRLMECPQNNTCCQIGPTQGVYGCCPVAKGVCCADRLHCCPANYKCDAGHKFCVNGDSMLPWLPVTMKTAQPHVKIGSSTGVMSKAGIVCPGGKARCPKATTCCQLKSGSYGCCPMVEAKCCKDHIHCCPKGSTCNLKAGTCDSVVDKTTSKLQKKFSAHSLEDVVICPDSKSTCPSGSTCCKMQSGEYGCCPMPKAVCCSDHLHCCPTGTTCDVAKGACNRGMYSVPWQIKTPAVKTGVTKGNTACPGGGSCPGGTTCCKMPSGKYGCCPYAKAVCCKDLVSCCPHGTTCDPTSKKCDSPGISTSWSSKNTLTLSGKVKAVSVICPDQSTCPTGNTCCQMKSGKYGCCPMDQAVCCSDHTHCCPHKTTCDVSHQSCLRAGDSVPWSVKLPARPVSQVSTQVVCPDKKSSCPSGQTCCLLKGGVWGCCPMPKAVCCKDGLHCCPESTTCDVAHGRCNSITNSLSISWTMVKWMSALTFSTAPPLAVTCPDKSMCPGVSTCCLQSSGRYGCCPLLNATCCADKLHCCPSGFKCQGEKCVRQGISVPMSQHTRHASKMPVGGTAIKCPDSNMECPDGTTCCKILKTKKYGCCPKPNAVCCADGIHCCPQGTKCDDKAGACVKAVPWSTKVVSRPVSQKSNSVICPDQKHECPDMNTCCRLNTGEWGCCPLPKAVCCADGKHCCPNGYTCDPTTAICNPGGNRLPRTAARLVAAVQGRYRVKN